MGKGLARWLTASALAVSVFAAAVGPGWAQAPPVPGSGDNPGRIPGATSLDNQLSDDTEAQLLALDNQFTAARTAGDNKLSIEQAGALRSTAANQAKLLKHTPAPGPTTFSSAWNAIGPNPFEQLQRSDGNPAAVAGRIGALVISKDGTFILGAAQGGIWTLSPTDVWDNGPTGMTWVNRTDNLPSLATGALAVAPSNDLVVYDGTGEGALSGDSYYGNGILKSTDGGMTWSHVSGDFFVGVSISRLAVDPNNANHLYASVLRGRGGTRRVSPPVHSTFGLWESKDGGVSWTLLKPAPAISLGATDIRIDPQNTSTLYASFWGDAIYKSTDGGATWLPIMNGLPANANFTVGPSRFSIGISHPSGAPHATLYTGFDWTDTAGTYHNSRIFKSTDDGASWTEMPTGAGPLDTIFDYCGTQCFYDNVVETDPINPNIVFVAGSFGYNMPIPSGGVFRSDDGGTTWKNLGWDLHPDFHALAFDPNNPAHVLIGNDGGIWASPDRGGRNGTSDAQNDPASLQSADFQNFDLNSNIDPNTGAETPDGLQISQFDSIATNPARPPRIWGGSQDNGTERKATATTQWFDLASGDGGQVLVDPTDSTHVYGTYFGISPWRITDGGSFFLSNQFIRNGIDRNDRSEFYTPFVLNHNNVNQLFLGTYRLYRTDNAKADSAGAVQWHIISPDLTTGCTGPSPNGARNCTISAIGVGGGTAVYTGSLDGLVYFSPNAQVSLNPTWTRVNTHGNSNNRHSLPNRPVAWIAVDRSDYRTAYVAFNGYNAATPRQQGHVFKTTDAGEHWTNISGNLPDNPVNSITLDPSYPNTLYAATDVGPFVTYNGGATWSQLGTGFPVVAIDQIDMNPGQTPRLIAAGTHGRGAWTLADSSAPVPALVLSKADAGVPVGPGSNLNYTLTVHNIGNAAATGVTVTDPIPDDTSFVSADSGGSLAKGVATWTGLSVPAGGSVSLHLTVQIKAFLGNIKSIVDDGYRVTSAQGVAANGSPVVTPIAPPFAVTIAPSTQSDGAHDGKSVNYMETVTNQGFKADSYKMSSSGGTFTVTFLDPTCTTPLTTTPSLVAGASTNVCVNVAVPANAANGATNTATVTATSVGSPTVSASATINTIAVAVDTLLVDEDGNNPDTNSFYTAALTSAGVPFSLWDLNANPTIPLHYMESFKHVIWFTGNSFPAPITKYESELKAYLDNGGHLFVSGQDLLDQAAGTTSFVHDYLHVTWDGSERQNDKATANVHEVTGTITAGVGAVPLNTSVLGNSFMDEITPNGTAAAIFTDDAGQPDGLSFSGTYKVVFISFPMEEYGSAAQKADLITRVINFFNS